MSYRKPLIGLSVFLVLSIVVTWLVYNTLERGVTGPTNTYTALFTDVTLLHPGDDVRVAGVRVGRVQRIDLDGTLAKVTFRVQRDQTLYTNTIASVRYQNIIGQRYLGLAPGPSDHQTPLGDYSQIPLEHTEPSFDISNLLNGFEPLFSLLDPQQVDNITSATIQALQGDSGSVLTLVTQTSALAESLAGPDQILGDAIINLNDAVTNLARQSGDLETVIRQSRGIMADLSNRRDTLIASAGSITSTLGRLATIGDNVYPDLAELIRRQPGFAAHLLGDGRARFAYLAANFPAFLKGLARMSEEGTFGQSYMCDINVTLFAFLGRMIPSLLRRATGDGAIKQSPVCR